MTYSIKTSKYTLTDSEADLVKAALWEIITQPDGGRQMLGSLGCVEASRLYYLLKYADFKARHGIKGEMTPEDFETYEHEREAEFWSNRTDE